MADKTGTINYNPTTNKTTLSVGSISLNYNEKLTLSIGTGFPTPANMQITGVEFWNDVNHGKGSTLLGSWARAGNLIVPEGVSVATVGSGIALSDSDDGTSDVSYYYNVTATDTVTKVLYTADPELVIRKKVHTTGGSASPTPDASV